MPRVTRSVEEIYAGLANRAFPDLAPLDAIRAWSRAWARAKAIASVDPQPQPQPQPLVARAAKRPRTPEDMAADAC